MLVIIHIAEQVAHNSGVANRGVDVGMRMAINPGIYAAVGNIVAKFCGEYTVQDGTHVLGCHYCQCRKTS